MEYFLDALLSPGSEVNPSVIRSAVPSGSEPKPPKPQPQQAAGELVDGEVLPHRYCWPEEAPIHLKSSQLYVPEGKTRMKCYALSDLHCDAEKNQQWVEENCIRVQEDMAVFTIFICPGDIGSDITRIRRVFRTLVANHDVVLFVPGNHEAWCRESSAATAANASTATDSCLKIAEVVCAAQECGVFTGPVRVTMNLPAPVAVGGPCTHAPIPLASNTRSVSIVPLYSWYHSCWDTEPELVHPLAVRYEHCAPFSDRWGDFSNCSWPATLLPGSPSPSGSPATVWSKTNAKKRPVGSVVPGVDGTGLAQVFATFNEPFLPEFDVANRQSENDTVITFSHFLPRQELLPEKRFILEPLLSRVVGSDELEKQIRRIMPDLHLFGHTHIPIDLEIEDVRYVQWPLGYSREARLQCGVVRAKGSLMCYDSGLCDDSSGTSGVPVTMPSTTASWSAYYRNYERDATVVGPLAPWVLQKVSSFGEHEKPSLSRSSHATSNANDRWSRHTPANRDQAAAWEGVSSQPSSPSLLKIRSPGTAKSPGTRYDPRSP